MSIADKIILLYAGKPAGYVPPAEEVQRVNKIIEERSKFASMEDETSSEHESTERFNVSGVIEVSDDSDVDFDDDFQKPQKSLSLSKPLPVATPVPTSIFCANARDEKCISQLQRRFSDKLVLLNLINKSEVYYTLQANAVPSVPNMIPIVNSARCSITVQGIYECFKVFKSNPHINTVMLQQQQKLKRKEPPKDLVGWQLGDQGGVITHQEAHDLYFILPYLWVLERAKPAALKFMRDFLKAGQVLLLLDRSTNFDINNPLVPVSVAALIKIFLEGKATSTVDGIKKKYPHLDLSMY